MHRPVIRSFAMTALSLSLTTGLGIGRITAIAQEIVDQERTELHEKHRELSRELNELTGQFRKPADLSPIPEALFQAAMAKGHEFLEVNRTLFGEQDVTVVETLSWIAARCEDAEEFEKAHEARKEALGIRIAIDGPEHWKTSISRRALAHCGKLAKLTKEERNHLKELRVSHDWISRFARTEDTIPLMDNLIKAQLELLGKEDIEYLASLYRRALVHLNMGNLDQGISILKKVMNTERRVLGKNHPRFGTTCYTIATAYTSVGKYELSKPYWKTAQTCIRSAHGPKSQEYHQWCEQLCNDLQEHSNRLATKASSDVSKDMLNDCLVIAVSVFGDDDWRTRNTRLSISYLAARQQMSKADRKELERAEQLEVQLSGNRSPEQVPKAIEAGKMVIGIRERIQGKQHRDYGLAVLKTAMLMQQNNELTEAVPLFNDAIASIGQVLTTESKLYKLACTQLWGTYKNLAIRASRTGDIPTEIGYLKLAVECLRDVKPRPAFLGTALNDLGLNLINTGDYALALTRLHEALKCTEETLNKEHREYATTLHNIGIARGALGDWAGSERALRQALQIREKVFGRSHPYYAQTLSILASQLEADEHERHLKLALEIARNHPEGDQVVLEPVVLSNLGLHYESEGNYELAEKYLLEAVEYFASRDWTPFAANAVQISLAKVYRDKEDMALSKKYLDKALQSVDERFGTNHPRIADIHCELATHHLLEGDKATAVKHLSTAMAVAFRQLHQSMYGVSERQQLSARRDLEHVLDLQLSLPEMEKYVAQKMYGAVYLSKGIVFQRQYLLRLARSDPSLLPVFTELETVIGRLSHLALGGEHADDLKVAKRQVDELSERVEELERKLSRRSREFRLLTSKWTEDIRPQSLMPEGTVLVDFLEYSKSTVSESTPRQLESETHLLAFVLRLNEPIVMEDLGPAEPIEQAVAKWRKTLGDGIGADGMSPSNELKRLVWQPLEAHMDGIDTLLISPDGVLTRIPFAALPGKTPGSYLVEQIPIAIVPVPRMFFIDRGADSNDQPSKNRLLLVGDIDYGGPPGKSGKSRSAKLKFRTGLVFQFEHLKGSRGEILQIGDTFESSFDNSPAPQKLRGPTATEDAFRKTAPGCRWIHIATHGFYAPPTLRSKLGDAATTGPIDLQTPQMQGLSTFHPGLLSGLALAGANREANAELDDGILTSLEVASIDLRGVELAVLSACETGLGVVAGGEGQLGLQRAFQVAGSRAVVSSMWKVNDRATQQLMSDFYQNLWGGKKEKKMSKLEALRAAQISMLKEGSRRGLGPALNENDSIDSKQRLPPYYWASFVLSGDWR